MSNKTVYTATQRDKMDTSQNFEARPVPPKAFEELETAAEEVGGPYESLPGTDGAVAFTHFDTPASQDNQLTILLTKENMDRLPLQTLVRINSLDDHGTLERS